MNLQGNKGSSSDYDIAIVGFGPSGAVAAGLLGMQGLRVFVCDKAHDIYSLPRAFALDHEVMRVFQQLGVAEQVLSHTEPFTPSEFYGVDGQLIKRFTTVAEPYPLGYVPSLVFTQPPVERILREHVQTLPSVDVALGCELLELTQNADGATLQLQNADGSTRQVRARYVIGCDGASSKVRSAAGLALQVASAVQNKSEIARTKLELPVLRASGSCCCGGQPLREPARAQGPRGQGDVPHKYAH